MLVELMKYIQGQSATQVQDASNENPLLYPKDMNLQCMEGYHSNRYRERYDMQTSSIDAFIEYTNEHSVASGAYGCITSVDSDTCTASAIFNASDEGGPGHCDDTANCQLKPLPMWKFLMKIGEQGVISESQRGVIDIIRDWHDYILDSTSLVGSFTRLKVESLSKHETIEKDFGRERTAAEKIDLKAEGGEVPSDIIVAMKPYDGFEERTLQIGISAVVNRSGDIELRLRVRGYEAMKLSIAEEFADKLIEALDVKPIIGTIRPA